MKVSSPVRRTATGGAPHPLQPPVAVGLWEMDLPSSPEQISPGIPGLQQLALQGKWREVVTRCRAFTATDTSMALSVSAFHVLGLSKLKMYSEASLELAKLGDLDDPQYFSGRSHGAVSLVPFALRWLHAELPALAGQVRDSADALHSLMQWCQQRRAAAVASGDAASLAVWQERRERAAFSLVGKLVRLAQHRAALGLLNQLLRDDPDHPEVWSQAGHVQLSLGDVAAAQRSFERAAAAATARQAQHPGSPQHAQPAGSPTATAAAQRQQQQQMGRWVLQIDRDRGLLLFAQQDFKAATEQYSHVLRHDPGDSVAATNRALSFMYGGNLSAAVQSLEGAFMTAPEHLLQEVAVLNLASMYDLSASGSSVEGKRRMAAWVAANAPDDLDLACTKTTG